MGTIPDDLSPDKLTPYEAAVQRVRAAEVESTDAEYLAARQAVKREAECELMRRAIRPHFDRLTTDAERRAVLVSLAARGIFSDAGLAAASGLSLEAVREILEQTK